MMYDQQVARRILQRLSGIRAGMLAEYPFFGTLLMRLSFGIARCDTAFTDMRRIVFDPEFVDRLNDEQLGFVMLHEVMHCVLNHCYRSRDFHARTYNIACDIVVNSNIMKTMGVTEFQIDDFEAMHLTPSGEEGYLYTAEEVYYMILIKNSAALPGKKVHGTEESISTVGKDSDEFPEIDAGTWDKSSGQTFDSEDLGEGMPKENENQDSLLDNHDPWKNLPAASAIQDEWREIVIKAGAKYAGTSHIPNCVRRYIEDLNYRGKADWRTLLREFISRHYDEYEYTYSPPDRRYIEYDIYQQSFRIQETERVENVWFCVDTSGSVSDKELNVLFSEIKQAVYQWRGLSGKVSFFDHDVTEPEAFSDLDELHRIQPKGGGGTSFYSIFRYMEEHMRSDLPKGIIILTDGCAHFPKEEAAFGIPVLWFIIGTKVQPPWGICVHIDSPA